MILRGLLLAAFIGAIAYVGFFNNPFKSSSDHLASYLQSAVDKPLSVLAATNSGSATASASPSATPAPTATATPSAILSFVGSIDTMKESQDTVNRQLTDAQIANHINLAASLNVSHITVNTFWDYPDYMQRWVNAIRKTGKHVWFRIHPNQWENQNGAIGMMTPSQYLAAESVFITSNPGLFKSGDILDICPEPENGPYWKSTYGQNWSWQPQAPNLATNDFNNFIVNLTSTANQALSQIGITGVITTVHSTSEWWAENPTALYDTTIAQMGGIITIDSYPDQNTTNPTTAAKAWMTQLNNIARIRPKAKILIGEIGYSNSANVSDSKQNSVISEELNSISKVKLAGLNYWVGAGGPNYGGYTNIFKGSAGKWTIRPAAQTLSAYFKTKVGH